MRSISKQNIISTYRFYAPLYDQLFGAILEPGRRALTSVVSKESPQTILEVGVGTGLTLFRYPKNAQVTGIDLSSDMLERARTRAARMRGRSIELIEMNAENMDFPDHAFDCVTVPYVLSVTPDPARLVRELRRVCKPGGRILILNHFSGSRFWQVLERAVQSLADKVGFRSDFSFQDQIEVHDWIIDDVRDVNLMGLSKLVLIRNC